MNKTQLRARMNSARSMIMLMFIFSIVTIASCMIYLFGDVLFGDVSFLLSITSAMQYGSLMFFGTLSAFGNMAYLIIAILISVILTVMYILAFVFSKRTFGWTIFAFVMICVDALVQIIVVATGWYPLAGYSLIFFFVDIFARVLTFIAFIFAIVAKSKIKAMEETEKLISAPEVPDVSALPAEMLIDAKQYATMKSMADQGLISADQVVQPNVRKITITRLGQYKLGRIPVRLTVNGKEVGRVIGNQNVTFNAPTCAFTLVAMDTRMGNMGGEVDVPQGVEDLTYQMSSRMGFIANGIFFTQINAVNTYNGSM